MKQSRGISRRSLLAMAGVSAGATVFAPRSLFAHEDATVATTANTAASARNTSFGSIKQIDAGLLNVGYAEAGQPCRRITARPLAETADEKH